MKKDYGSSTGDIILCCDECIALHERFLRDERKALNQD